MANSKKLPANQSSSLSDTTEAVTDVQHAIASSVADVSNPSFLVGFSGGLDSVVLLHAAQTVCGPEAVIAVHVNHGLQSDAGAWAEHCAQTATELGVKFHCENAAMRPAKFFNGLEAWARNERRAAFVRAAQHQSVNTVMLAHHRDDQAETVLWHLARGAGPDGISGMRTRTDRDGLRLLRPLLALSRQTLRAYADHFQLVVIDDPSNAQLVHTRNRIRHEVMPQLKDAFPGFDRALARAATNAADVTDALQLALFDGDPPETLSRSELRNDPELIARQKLRIWLQSKQVAMPDRRVLLSWLPRLLEGENTYVQIDHGDDQLCRYRDLISLRRNVGARATIPPTPVQFQWDGQASMTLPGFDGELQFANAQPGELAIPADRLMQETLTISPLRMSARIRLQVRGPSRPIKQLCQEHAIARWDRESLPMLWWGQTPLFVARVGMNVDYLDAAGPRNRGVQLRWQVSE
jgi:tRNA(Ile)-lysidine synthase